MSTKTITIGVMDPTWTAEEISEVLNNNPSEKEFSAKEHLERYGKVLRKDMCLRREYQTLQDRGIVGTEGHFEKIVAINEKGLFNSYKTAQETLAEELTRNMDGAIAIRREVVAALEQMNSDIERQVLYYRYLCLLKWSEIAELMNYEERSILKIHRRALSHYVMPEIDRTET